MLEGRGLSREMVVVGSGRIRRVRTTYRQICCRQWPSCAVSAEEASWTRGCWVEYCVVSRRRSNGSPDVLLVAAG